MSAVDQLGERYSQLPSRVVGFAAGSWEAFMFDIVTLEHGLKARNVRLRGLKDGAMPVVVV